MSTDSYKRPTGFKIRFGTSARDQAEEVARALVEPPMLEEDDSLPPENVALDVSFEDGTVETDASVDKYMG